MTRRAPFPWVTFVAVWIFTASSFVEGAYAPTSGRWCLFMLIVASGICVRQTVAWIRGESSRV